MRAIVWRAEEFWEDNIKVATMPDGDPALEQRFEVPFSVTGERLSGRIDKVVELDNELYVVDTKTTKTGLTSYYFANFTPNNQVYAYLWAAKHILKLPVVGFIVEAAQTGVNFTRFERAVFKVNDEVIQEWYIDSMHKIDLSNMYAKDNYYPADFTACSNYGGCKFREVCNEAPSRRHIVVESDFDREVHKDLRKEDNVVALPTNELEIEVELE